MTNYCSQCGGRIAGLEEGCVICRGAVGTGEAAAASVVEDSPERLVAEISLLLQAESSPAAAARVATPPHTSVMEPDAPASQKAEPAVAADFDASISRVAAQPREVAAAKSPVEPERPALDITQLNAGLREETPGINLEELAAGLGEGREKSLGEAAAVLSATATRGGAEGETVRIGGGAGGSGTAAAERSADPSPVATEALDAAPHTTSAATSPAPSTAAVEESAAAEPRGHSGGRAGVLAHAPLAGLLSLVFIALSTFLLWFTAGGGGDGARAVTGLTRGDGQLILGLTCLALVAGVRSWRRQLNRTLGYMVAGGWGTFVLCYLTGLIKHLVATGEVRTAAGLYVGAAAAAVAAVTFVLGAIGESGLAGGGAARRLRGQVFGAHAVAVIAGIMLSGLAPKYMAPPMKEPGVRPAASAAGGEQRPAKKRPLVVSGEEGETLSSAPVVSGDSPQTGQATDAAVGADSAAVQESGRDRANTPAPSFADVDAAAIPDVPDIPIARGRPSGARQRRGATSPAPTRRSTPPEPPRRGGGGKAAPAGAPSGSTQPAPNPNTWRPGRQP